MITALATIFVFGLIVFIHELGHFITAKLSGMRVDEFAIGFGPVLLKTVWRTLYSVRCIPLGGFNRIAGMTPDEPLDDGSFYTKPAYKNLLLFLLVLFFNFLLAIVIYFGLMLQLGEQWFLLIAYNWQCYYRWCCRFRKITGRRHYTFH